MRVISLNLNFKVSTFHVDHEDSQVSLLSLSCFSLHISSLDTMLANTDFLCNKRGSQ